MPVSLEPGTVGGLVGGLIPAAAIGLGWAARVIIKHRRAVARGVIAGLDIKPEAGENSGQGDQLTAAIMEFLRRQEADRQADRRNDDRKWERIEQLLMQAKEAAQASWAINQTIQNMATWIDRTHQLQSSAIESVSNNQILLSNYLRERLGGGAWPSQHTRPPLAGGN